VIFLDNLLDKLGINYEFLHSLLDKLGLVRLRMYLKVKYRFVIEPSVVLKNAQTFIIGISTSKYLEVTDLVYGGKEYTIIC